MNPQRYMNSWAGRGALLVLLATLGHCDATGCRPSGGAIPPDKFAFHRVPDDAARQVACVDITFYHFSSPPISWHCPTEVSLAASGGPAGAQALAAEVADEAARHVMSLGRPASTDEACGSFYGRMKAALGRKLPGAAVGPFDACSRHRLPVKAYP